MYQLASLQVMVNIKGEMIMTTITDAASATSTDSYTSTIAGSEASELQEQFLKLLLVQLENQDPLDPVDSDQFVSQLCDLSQLEQASITNDYLETLETSSISSQAASYIGKSVNVEGSTVEIAEDGTGEISFEIDSYASDAVISLIDDEGSTVYSEVMSDLSAGTYTASLEDLGEEITGGTYTFSVSAYDEEGAEVGVTTYSSVEITGVIYEDGTPYLVAGDETISLSDVTGLHQS